MTAKKKTIDWEAVERDYRAGILTDRELAKAHGCSHTGVAKRAKRQGWTRDLNARIRATADRKVAQALCKLAQGQAGADADVREQEQAIVEDNAAMQAGARLAMRGDIVRAAALCNTMMAELEALSGRPRELEELILMVAAQGGEDGAASALELAKAVSLPMRVTAMGKLAGAMTRLTALKRQALGIDRDAGTQSDDPWAEMLALVGARGRALVQ